MNRVCKHVARTGDCGGNLDCHRKKEATDIKDSVLKIVPCNDRSRRNSCSFGVQPSYLSYYAKGMTFAFHDTLIFTLHLVLKVGYGFDSPLSVSSLLIWRGRLYSTVTKLNYVLFLHFLRFPCGLNLIWINLLSMKTVCQMFTRLYPPPGTTRWLILCIHG